MNILVICYSYAPNIDPRALRWTALCEEWAKQGHRVHVVTGLQPGLSREEMRNGVKIRRAGGLWRARLMQRAMKHPAPSQTDNHICKQRGIIKDYLSSEVFKSLHITLKKLHGITWKRVYWPDGCAHCISKLYRVAKNVTIEVEIDLLVTVSHPFSCHIVGMLLQRRNPTRKWIADSGDPFSFLNESPVNNYKLYSRLNVRAEERLLECATVSTVTTFETAETMKKMFPAHRNKIVVIPPLLRLVDLPTFAETDIPSAHETITAVYAGGWHKNIREPAWVLEAISEMIKVFPSKLKGLQVHFYGDCSPVHEALKNYPQIRDRIVLEGLVQPKEALLSMFLADLLINVGNKTFYQLPSKVVEYVASGLPILNICHSETDSSACFFQEYTMVRNLIMSPIETCNILFTKENILEAALYVSECKGKKMSRERLDTITSKFAAPRLAKEYFRVAGVFQD